MAKMIGYGITIETTTSTGTMPLAYVRSVSGPSATVDDVDTTTLDSTGGFRTFIAGLIDGGEVEMELVYDPSVASHATLGTRFKARTAHTYTITHPSTTSNAPFSGYIKGMSREIPLDDVVTCTVTFKVSGNPGYISS